MINVLLQLNELQFSDIVHNHMRDYLDKILTKNSIPDKFIHCPDTQQDHNLLQYWGVYQQGGEENSEIFKKLCLPAPEHYLWKSIPIATVRPSAP